MTDGPDTSNHSDTLSRNPPGSTDPHVAGTARLEQILRRGQRAGDFDRAPPATWLTAAILGLAQAAAEQVAAGRLTAGQAGTMLVDSTLRLCGAAGEPKKGRDSSPSQS
jgi:hypothetical protein